MGARNGYGTLEESSKKNSKYTGAWKDDKRNGYGVYNDKMKYAIDILLVVVDYNYCHVDMNDILECGLITIDMDQALL